MGRTCLYPTVYRVRDLAAAYRCVYAFPGDRIGGDYSEE